MLRDMVEFMKATWQLEMPSVIFSVTGTALPFELRRRYLEVFSAGLVNATRNTNAWVVTGGTGVGVMRLIGDALSRFQSREVTLGIAPWGAIHGRTRLTAEKQEQLHLPLCTLRIDNIPSPHRHTEELAALLSNYGKVIGITVWRECEEFEELEDGTLVRREGPRSVEVSEDVDIYEDHHRHHHRHRHHDNDDDDDDDDDEKKTKPKTKENEEKGAARPCWTLVSFSSEIVARNVCVMGAKGLLKLVLRKAKHGRCGATPVARLHVRHVKSRFPVHSEEHTAHTEARSTELRRGRAEAHSFAGHVQKVVTKRGSTVMPYVYDGLR